MLLSELIKAACLFYRADGSTNIEIRGISTDTREVGEGNIFVCIRGRKYNSHKMVNEAIAGGAVAVVAEEEIAIPPGITVIYTQDTTVALARLWDAWYCHPAEGLHLIAVTGTNGKTTTAFLLDKIFSSALYRTGIIGTVCARTHRRILPTAKAASGMTTPEPGELFRLLAEMKKDGTEYVFLEVSSHALAQNRVEPLSFDGAIFTNLTPEHLDYHGDMESYFLSKAELLRKTRIALINRDNPYFERYLSYARAMGCSAQIRSYSPSGDTAADFRAENIELLGRDGVAFTFASSRHIFGLSSKVPGSFTVDNTLAAASLACELGIKPNTTVDAIASFEGVVGRMWRVPLNPRAGVSVYIDYAHTPDALEKLLNTARALTPPQNKLWVVFGCGGDRDRSKRPTMGRIASTLSDVCIITSDNSRGEITENIISEILRGVACDGRSLVIPPRRLAIEYAVLNARDGDVIILAGKGHEQVEIRGEERIAFSEKDIVLSCAKLRNQ